MSRENVEVIKAGLAAVTRGDIDAVQAAFHPDAEFRSSLSSVDADAYRGPGLAAQWLDNVDEIFEEYRIELEDVIGEGDRLVAVVRNIGRGKGSGVPLEDRRYVAITFKDGRIWRGQTFAVKEEALEAVGLSE